MPTDSTADDGRLHTALARIARASASDDLTACLRLALEEACAALALPAALVLDCRGGGARLAAGRGWYADCEPSVLAAHPAVAVARNGAAEVREALPAQGATAGPASPGAYAALPIALGAPPYGVLSVESAQPRRFEPAELAFLHAVADCLGAAIWRQHVLEDHDRFRQLAEATSDAIAMADRRGQIFYLNAAARDLLQVGAAASAADFQVPDFYPPAELERLRRESIAVAEARGSWRGEVLLRSLAGAEIPVSTVMIAHRAADGAIAWYGIVARDIREQGEAQRALRASEERFRRMAEDGGVGIWELDREGLTRYLNRAMRELLGVGEDDALLGKPPSALMAPETVDTVQEQLARRRRGESSRYEAVLLRADGERRHVLIAGAPLRDERGEYAGAIATFTDITERKRAEEALQESERRYRALYDDNPAMFFTLDAAGTVLSVNRFGAERLGYSAAELVGRPVELFYREPAAAVAERLADCDQQADRVRHWEARLRCRDGTLLWVRVVARRVARLRRPQYLLVCEDVSEARELSAELSYQSTHDALTGLANRREFERQLAELLRGLRQHPGEHAVCYLDLDQFKLVNDTCGHYAGDELLRQAAKALAEVVSRSDTLARLGGDEFGVLLVQCGAEDARRVADRLRQALAEMHFAWEGRGYDISASIGLVPVTQADESPAEVLRLADAACYAAKDEGRDRIHVYHENDVELARRQGEMQWVTRVREALGAGRFRLNYQSIVPVSGAAAGLHYELLLRMLDEQGNPVAPGLFLPAAERYNLMVQLDRWVVDHALHWLSRRADHQARLDLCSINLSGQSLGDTSFLEFVTETLRETGVPPTKLCFEITETAAIGNLDRASHFIEALRAIGCRFALDDFGTGLSSFGYLKNLPVDYLKIDGLFVRDIVEDPIDFSVVKSIHELGQVMGKRTIAEFVENEQILGKLREIGVDYAQGYGIGRPVPLDELN